MQGSISLAVLALYQQHAYWCAEYACSILWAYNRTHCSNTTELQTFVHILTWHEQHVDTAGHSPASDTQAECCAKQAGTYLAQPLVLCKCPLRHWQGACCNEQEGCNCLCGHPKKNPAPDLKCVICTCDIVEGKALGYDILLGPWWSQVT